MTITIRAKLHRRLRDIASGEGLKARMIRGSLGGAGIQAANRMLALALGILLARMLGPDGYGIYAYAFAIMSLLMVVAEAGVPTLLMREVAASHARAEWGLLRGAIRRGFQAVAGTAIAISVLGLTVLWWFAGSLRDDVFYTIGLMLLVLPAAALCKTVAHALQGLHRVVVGQAVDLLGRPVLVLALVAFVFVTFPDQRRPQVAMAAQFLAGFLVLVIGALVLRHRAPHESRGCAPAYDTRRWGRSLLPFALVGGAGIVNNQADIIMIGWFLEARDVGAYRVAVQGGALIALAQQAINTVISPQISTFYTQGDYRSLNTLVTQSARIFSIYATCMAFFIFAFSEYLIFFVFGPEFTAAQWPLIVLIGSQTLALSFFGFVGPVVAMMNGERFMSYSFIFCASLNVAMNLIVIPLYGLAGAALASGFTMVLLHVILFLYAKKTLFVDVTPFARLYKATPE